MGVMKAIQEVAVRAAAKAAREALLQMASRGKVKLSADWKPTALISVINARSDLSDMEKIKLAAKAKMEGNLGDLLPKRFLASGNMRDKDDNLAGKLKFDDDNISEARKMLIRVRGGKLLSLLPSLMTHQRKSPICP